MVHKAVCMFFSISAIGTSMPAGAHVITAVDNLGISGRTATRDESYFNFRAVYNAHIIQLLR